MTVRILEPFAIFIDIGTLCYRRLEGNQQHQFAQCRNAVPVAFGIGQDGVAQVGIRIGTITGERAIGSP